MKKAPRAGNSRKSTGSSKSRGSSSSKPRTTGSRPSSGGSTRSFDKKKDFGKPSGTGRKTSRRTDDGPEEKKEFKRTGSSAAGKNARKKELRRAGRPEEGRPSSRNKHERSDRDEKPSRTYKISNDDGTSEKRTFRRASDNEGSSEKKGFQRSSERAERPGKTGFSSSRSDKREPREEGEDRPRTRSFSDYRERKKTFGRDNYRDKPYRKRSDDRREKPDDGQIRLNKYIANAGICSRREADDLIKSGVVTVNGAVITEMGHKVTRDDRIMVGDRPIRNEKPVYILLNKPKDYITTSKDPQNRKTVLELIHGVKERIFPVGRLDRNTTGLLLFTNDGEMAERLMHPRKKVVKIYHAELDKKLAPAHLESIAKGVELEDGVFRPDEISFIDGHDKHHVGIEIHSGKNRIVRRLFEHFGYKVVKLDRVLYAGLSKKGIPRGEWRHLREDEVNMLKMIG